MRIVESARIVGSAHTWGRSGRSLGRGCRERESRGGGGTVRHTVGVLGCGADRRVVVEPCAFRLGGQGHEHNAGDRAGQHDQSADGQRAEAAGCQSLIAVAITVIVVVADGADGAVQRRAAADDHDEQSQSHHAAEDGDPPAGLVRIVQAADGERQAGDDDGQVPQAGEEVQPAVRDVAEQGQQGVDDDGGQRPPPEFTAGGASPEHRVFLPEAEEGFGEGASVVRLVQRHRAGGGRVLVVGGGNLAVGGGRLGIGIGVRSGLAVGLAILLLAIVGLAVDGWP